MKFGRILRDTPDGPQPRLVSVHPNPDGVAILDLATAYVELLIDGGATPRMARALARAQFPGSLTEALEFGDHFIDTVRRVHAHADDTTMIDGEEVNWISPVDPPVLRDFNAFKNHEATAPDVWFQVPLYFKINPSTIVGDGAQIVWPGECEHMDYELELGLVIGKRGVDLTPDNAADVLFGVTIFNDFSVRNLLRKEMEGRLGPAKGKDFASAIGPWVVTTDEIDIRNLPMTARINGELWSSGNSGDIIWSIEEILSYASRSEPLVPGEVIGTGTVAGGSGWELDRKLQPGDVVELTIDGIGTLRNIVGAPEAAPWVPRERGRDRVEVRA
ncbi:fumarylacetoacetate hydrolase family protein [Nocardia sp. NBC_01499]|uniref:fumarylacetoacetate hydrolase family protein n=1 Tax=Nocardia sp. NBC_01499 TaxID=2903597 RepID=UPI0038645220